MKKFAREKESKKYKKITSLLLSLFLCLLFLLSLQVYLASQLVEEGKKITFLAEKTEILKKENDVLEKKITSKTSLFYISQKAQEKGLKKITSVIYLTSPSTVAYNKK